MTEQDFNDYLENRYQKQISYYSIQAASNKRFYQAFQWGVILLSATVPIFVVLFENSFRWITATLSVLLGIGTSALKAFKFQENWTNYRSIGEALKKEKHFYDADLGDYAQAADKRSHFVARVESVLSRENLLWLSIYQQKEAQKEPPKTAGSPAVM